MPDELEPTGLKAWKRARPASTPAAGTEPTSSGGTGTSGGTDRPIMCGGPELTVRQRFELMRRLQREMDEATEREKEEARKKEKAAKAKAAEDSDDDAAAERFRNDRYAVGLLRKQSSDWGSGGSAGSGVLG